MSQVESMRGVKILIPRRRGIRSGRDGSPLPSLTFDGRDGTGLPAYSNWLPQKNLRSRAGIRVPTIAAKPGTETSPDIDVEEKLKEAFSRGWSVLVWNDPVNLMDYVVYVFKTVLKMNEKDASRHMWEVHQKGKSVVATETREKSELIVHRLRGFGLNATLEQA
jgi:ATP-dependent Clp protease adaptor protein ClpS